MPVRELRLVVTAPDYDEALTFYRDVLGLPQLAEFESPGGHVVLLDAGRATLELMDDANAAYVDDVEVGRRARPPPPRRPAPASSRRRLARRGTRSTRGSTRPAAFS
jgi:catechol 2,3-dioxygenase-like lactoylglutathione lyase family enzyme